MIQIIDHGFFVLFDTVKAGVDRDTDTQFQLNESNSTIYSYVIMPRHGKNLDDVFNRRNYKFTKQ